MACASWCLSSLRRPVCRVSLPLSHHLGSCSRCRRRRNSTQPPGPAATDAVAWTTARPAARQYCTIGLPCSARGGAARAMRCAARKTLPMDPHSRGLTPSISGDRTTHRGGRNLATYL
eukprot:358454-Chlamydomonas_euryale.AAC.9